MDTKRAIVAGFAAVATLFAHAWNIEVSEISEGGVTVAFEATVTGTGDSTVRSVIAAFDSVDRGNDWADWEKWELVGDFDEPGETFTIDAPAEWGDTYFAARFFVTSSKYRPYLKEVASLSSQGNSSFDDIGYSLTQNSIVTMKAAMSTFNGGLFFGNFRDTTLAPDGGYWRMFPYASTILFDLTGEDDGSNLRLWGGIGIAANTPYVFEMGNHWLNIDGQSAGAKPPKAYSTLNQPTILMSSDYGTIYWLQIKESADGPLTADYIPVIDKDGHTALYDNIGKRVITCTLGGRVDFTPGADVEVIASDITAIASDSLTFVYPSLAVNNLHVKSSSVTNIVMSLDLIALGGENSSCDVYSVVAANGKTTTNLVASGVVSPGPVDFALSTLRPGSVYTVGAIVEPDVDEAVELSPVAAKTKEEAFPSGVNSRDGFVQNISGSTWDDGFTITGQPASAYVDGPWAVHTGNGTSIGPRPWTGRLVTDGSLQTYNWRDYVTFGYECEMYMEAGNVYTVVINEDDYGSFWVDGTEIYWTTGQGGVSFADMHRGAYNCTETGWHNLRLYTGNGTGGYGPYGSFYGMGWSTDNVNYHPFTNETGNVIFKVPFDSPATIESAAIASAGATFTVAFNPAAAGGAARAYAFADYPGTDISQWGEPVEEVTLPQTAKHTFAFEMPAGARYVAFLCENGEFIYTTGSVPVGEIELADESAVDARFVQVADAGQISAEIEVNIVSTGGAGGVDITVEYGYEPGDLSYSHTTNSLAAGVRTVKLPGLDPDHLYYARITSSNGSAAGEPSEVFSFKTAKVPSMYGSTRASGVSLPGLWQAMESGGITGDVLDHPTTVRTLSPWAGNMWFNPGASDPKWTVWDRDGVEGECGWINGYEIAYKGYIYLEAGMNLLFGTQIDDYCTIDFNGVRYLERNNGQVNPGVIAETGWYPIQVIFGDWLGGAGNQYWNGFSMMVDGYNWVHPIDAGDGALLRTAPGVCDGRVVSHSVGAGALSAELEFGAWRYADGLALHIVYGDEAGGDEPETWANDDTVATIDKEDLGYAYVGLSGCGTAYHFARFYIVDPVSEIWQWCGDALYMPDAAKPVVGEFSLDGSFGDKLRITGSVSSAGAGEAATLTVFVSANADMSGAVAWEIAGTYASGDGIDETLFEADTASARYIAPGSTRYVRLQLAAQSGAKDVSKTVQVALASAASFKALSFSAVDANAFVTMSGALADTGAGAGEATVYLYAGMGENSLELRDSRVVTRENPSFTFTNEYPQVNATGYYKYIVSNACDTAFWTVDSGVMSIFVRDQYAYYWDDSVHDGAWETAANWSVEGNPPQATWPNTSHCAAVFAVDPAETNTPYRVTLTSRVYVNTLHITTAGTDITFEGNGYNGADFNSSSSGIYHENWWVADYFAENVAITFKNLHFNSTRVMFNNGMHLTFDNAYGYMRSDSYVEYKNYCELLLKNGATFAQHGGSFRAVGGHNFRLAIDDSTFILPSFGCIYMAVNAWSSGDWDIEFYGANPVLEARYHCIAYQTDNINAVEPRMIFHVPAGGYTREPVHCYNDGGWDFSAGQARLLVEVANDSPARVTGADCPLIVCSAPNHFKDSLVELGAWTAYDTEDIAEATQIRAVIPRGGTVIFIR
ncbi:MAG: fibronectin type III domain-containing protein [Kiritimatiellae bacterium]|nr:fibronectin type III domain-containing protein [Kiritimatiellia bacterium]